MSKAASLIEVEEQLRQLQERRTRLLSEVEHVDEQILLAQSRRATLFNESAPISRLPHELLTSIFAITREEDTRWSFQVIASHVCAKWRAVATTTPLFWSDIHVILTFRNSNSKSETDAKLERFHTYLARSNNCNFRFNMGVNGNVSLEPFLRLLGLHMFRCQSLSFAISNHPSPVLELQRHLSPLEAPRLQHLSIHIPYSRLFSHERKQFSIVNENILRAGAPELHFLRATGIAGYLQPPLSRLTTLHLDGSDMDSLTFEQFRNILQNTPEVVNLSMHDLWVDIAVFGSPSRISIPRLRCLRIRTPPEYDLHSLLIRLPVAQLESCILSRIESFRPIEFTNVKTLALDDCSLTLAEVGDLMLGFPAVHSLTLVSGDHSTIIFALGFPGTSLWWPKLKLLSVNGLSGREVPLFVYSIRNRQATDVPLEKLYLDRTARTAPRFKEEMEEVRALLPVEKFKDTAPWPVGLGLEDEDDGFWD